MQHRLFLSLVFPMSLLLVACSSGPSMSPGEQNLSDARTGLKSSDFNAALKNLDGAIKSAGDTPPAQQAALLHVSLLTALSGAGQQLNEAYALGEKKPPAQSR